jgi:hypothetical protein
MQTVPSIDKHREAIEKLAKRITIACPGFDPLKDKDCWDWADRDNAIIALKALRDIQDIARGAERRIADKLLAIQD